MRVAFHRWRFWPLSLAALFILLQPASPAAQEKKNLRVVFTGLAWNSELSFRVALARGYFKSQGLEIQPIFVRGGPAALAALSSGEVNFAEIGGAQAIMRSRARGLDAVIIGAISNATNYQIVGSKSTLSGDLSVNLPGLQFMLDEDKRSGLIDAKFTLDRAINDRVLKIAQQELRVEGRLK